MLPLFLVSFFVSLMGLGIFTSRHLTFAAAKVRLSPDLTDLREVLQAALDSGEKHSREKIKYAVDVLHELTV